MKRRECYLFMFKFVRKMRREDNGAFFLKLMGLSSTLDCQE